MNNRLMLNLVLVVVVCVLGWFALQRSQTPKRDDSRNTESLQSRCRADHRIAVAKPGHPEIRLEKTG